MKRGRNDMKRIIITLLAITSVVFSVSRPAYASLLTIGTATYEGSDYQLIYDVEDQITWLDYSNSGDTYPGSLAWAASLNDPGELIINLDEGYSAPWDSTEWRLAGNTTGNFGYYSSDRYVTSSEMAGLYYGELGNELNDTSLNFGDFENLFASSYHMSADAALMAQLSLSFSPVFNFSNGIQGFGSSSVNGGIYGVAVISGAVIPEPASLGLLGLVTGGIYFTRRFFIA